MRFPRMRSGAAAGGHGTGRALHAARASGGGVMPAYTCLPNVPDEMELEIIKNMGPAELQALRATSSGCRAVVDDYVGRLEGRNCFDPSPSWLGAGIVGLDEEAPSQILALWAQGRTTKTC